MHAQREGTMHARRENNMRGTQRTYGEESTIKTLAAKKEWKRQTKHARTYKANDLDFILNLILGLMFGLTLGLAFGSV